MDIWAWTYNKKQELIDAGHHRLVHLMDELPSYVCSDDHNRVDAIYPEALALAKSIGDSWCEIFIRHWYLQSQVLNRNNSKGMLEEAIDLLDFAHQEENKDCPQRICAVQDLANCYGISDHLGYADERIEVSLETLNSINGSWPCYDCVGGELIEALIDKGDPELLQQHLDMIRQELSKHNKTITGDLAISYVNALMQQEKYEDAKQHTQKAYCLGGGERFQKNKNITLATCHCMLQEWEQAKNICPTFDEISDTPAYFDDWTDVQFMLTQAGIIPFTQETVYQFNKLAHDNAEKGAIRYSLDIYSRLIEMCIENHYLFSAQNAIELMDKLIPQLAKDMGATQKRDKLAAQLQATLTHAASERDQQADFVSAEALLNHEFSSVDEEAWALEKNFTSFQDDSRISIRLAKIYQYYFRNDKAEAILEQAYTRDPTGEGLEYQYGKWILEQYGIDEYLSRFRLDSVDRDQPSEQDWSRIWLHLEAAENHNPEQALEYADWLLKISPKSVAALYKAFDISKSARMLEHAANYIDRIIAIKSDDKNFYWDKAVIASLQQDWPTVVQCTELLEIDFDDALPIHQQNFGKVRIRFEDEHGNVCDLLAERTGPVTAKIIGVANEEDIVYFQDTVVFDPAPLNNLDQQDEEGYRCDSEGFYTWLYACEDIIDKQHYQIIPVDGVHPGEDNLDRLIAQLEPLSVAVKVRSNEEYEIYYENEEGCSDEAGNESSNEEYTSLPGIYMYLMVNDQTDLNQLHAELKVFSDQQAHPLTWLRLAEQIGDKAAIQAQHDIIEKYELY